MQNPDLEAFIPFSRRDLMSMILADSTFAASQGKAFAAFAQLLGAWLAQAGVRVDFDIEKTLTSLQSIQCEDQCLLQRDEAGLLQVLPLPQACLLLDQIWDGLYQFARAAPESSL